MAVSNERQPRETKNKMEREPPVPLTLSRLDAAPQHRSSHAIGIMELGPQSQWKKTKFSARNQLGREMPRRSAGAGATE
jgi:hypothetical protein